MEIRQVGADERADTMFPLQAYAFTPSPWPADDEADYRRRMTFYRTVTSLIAEEDGRTLAGEPPPDGGLVVPGRYRIHAQSGSRGARRSGTRAGSRGCGAIL